MSMDQELASFESFLKNEMADYLLLENRLNEAVRYSLLSGGKRIRPLFCLAFAEAFAGRHAVALRAAVAVEMIHTYSLIHDDLPAMDDDDERRGKPTNHKVFGEAMAILAGDALLNLAPEYLLRSLSALKVEAVHIIDLTQSLMRAAGHTGMILGQVLDLEAEGVKCDLATLRNIHDKKTAALISWSAEAGLYATLNTEKIETHLPKVRELGRNFGVLFQIIDDLLDVEQDELSGKTTYVSLLGLEGARKEATNLIHKLSDEMKKIPGNWATAKELLALLEKRLPTS